MDNCRVHNSEYIQFAIKKADFKRTPHPLYLSDNVPSDFFLFDFVKRKLYDQSFKEKTTLKRAIVERIQSFCIEVKQKDFDE